MIINKKLSRTDLKYLTMFAYFLKKYDIGDHFFKEKDNNHPFPSDIPEVINKEFMWSGTDKGWLFWANISVRWKQFLAKHHYPESIRFWEIGESSWSKVDDEMLKKYIIS